MTDIEKTIRGLECCLSGPMQCDHCPYKDSDGTTIPRCVKTLKNDALSLLKAQEPRAMTKEEIIGWDGYIWFEFCGMRAMKAVLIDHGMVREPFRGDYPTKELSWGTCQETWRAWTSRPTDEQREAVKWDK